jgi:hypothetical protein
VDDGGQVWWYTALGRLRQEDGEFKASLGYIVRSCLLKKEIGWIDILRTLVSGVTPYWDEPAGI